MTDTTMTVTLPDGTESGPFTADDLNRAAAGLKGRTPMRETDADREVRDTAASVAGEELRQFVERYERLAAEKADIADAQKEVMAEAKGRGYDTKVLRKVIALRKRDRDDVAEEEAIMEMYCQALGMR
ncbi:Uncharacterized conserved protein, UPF0335 family [Wenxinia saemankumensis]|uniref:Uncharacterized conserved protein, UPF0335 family n=2 Tax=Wenxinia saemankumensis TaxID=1447782 RepID=A0A1M6EZ70_9RHOB|nr:Uncharacterized conserved protein, UPF0335 family [Wenxinia saemankumensis]